MLTSKPAVEASKTRKTGFRVLQASRPLRIERPFPDSRILLYDWQIEEHVEASPLYLMLANPRPGSPRSCRATKAHRTGKQRGLRLQFVEQGLARSQSPAQRVAAWQSRCGTYTHLDSLTDSSFLALPFLWARRTCASCRQLTKGLLFALPSLASVPYLSCGLLVLGRANVVAARLRVLGGPLLLGLALGAGNGGLAPDDGRRRRRCFLGRCSTRCRARDILLSSFPSMPPLSDALFLVTNSFPSLSGCMA